MIKKTTILSLLFFCFLSVSYTQENNNNQPQVTIDQIISQNSMTLSFDNQREINENKLPLFKSRLVNYYTELDDINYDSNDNRFILTLNVTEIEKEDLDGILNHFNVYNYSIEIK
ncbi:MAG: hypothetical protein COA32_06435 [Fluviicola sp.]|nr:MAG: hypothetical protein COA32_06435 [Fluviicola sp.]